MAVVKQLYALVENKPGSLAQISAALSKAKINLIAINVPEEKGGGAIRLVVGNAGKAKAALKKLNITCDEEDVIAVEIDEKPGSLAGIADRLAAAGINIESAYATGVPGSQKTMLILSVSDVITGNEIAGG